MHRPAGVSDITLAIAPFQASPYPKAVSDATIAPTSMDTRVGRLPPGWMSRSADRRTRLNGTCIYQKRDS